MFVNLIIANCRVVKTQIKSTDMSGHLTNSKVMHASWVRARTTTEGDDFFALEGQIKICTLFSIYCGAGARTVPQFFSPGWQARRWPGESGDPDPQPLPERPMRFAQIR